jgi:hypothetical protein
VSKMRLLIAAGLATLLGTVSVVAQDLDQGGQSQSEQILKKKKKKMDQPSMEDQGQLGGNAQSSKKKLRRETLTDERDQNIGAKKLKKRQAIENETDEDQAGQAGAVKKKKVRKTEEDQSDQAARKQRKETFSGLPAEKRSVVRKKLVSRDVQRVHRNKLKFRIGVGVRVPRTIRFYPLPPDVIEFVPAYRGYLYFLTEDGLVVIIDPRTFEIVSVFPA